MTTNAARVERIRRLAEELASTEGQEQHRTLTELMREALELIELLERAGGYPHSRPVQNID